MESLTARKIRGPTRNINNQLLTHDLQASGHEIILRWLPGHADIPGNKQAQEATWKKNNVPAQDPPNSVSISTTLPPTRHQGSYQMERKNMNTNVVGKDKVALKKLLPEDPIPQGMDSCKVGTLFESKEFWSWQPRHITDRCLRGNTGK